MRIAVMQPYFYPYMGYFKLFLEADLFVIFDCVQFPRRGWVHRNQMTHKNGNPSWLTLPIQKGPREITRICDLVFQDQFSTLMRKQLETFKIFHELDEQVIAKLQDPTNSVMDYLEYHLKGVASHLRLETETVRSSTLSINPNLKGQFRVLEIVKQLGGDEYINLSGGVDLYEPELFEKNGITLKILRPHTGSKLSMLERLTVSKYEDLIDEIHEF